MSEEITAIKSSSDSFCASLGQHVIVDYFRKALGPRVNDLSSYFMLTLSEAELTHLISFIVIFTINSKFIFTKKWFEFIIRNGHESSD